MRSLVSVTFWDEGETWLRQEKLNFSTLEVECPYGMACLQEGTRLTALAIGGIRRAPKPLVLTSKNGQEWTVNKGEMAAISLILPNTDEALWNDPYTFAPRRFLDNAQSRPTLFTFSQGTHRCPGERLAMVLMYTMVTCLVVNYRIQLTDTQLPALSWERATIAQRAGRAKVTVQNLTHSK